MRICALDVGDRTVGVAVSDPLEITANPREVLRRDGKELERLADMVSSEGIEHVVVGMPYTLRGEIGPQAQKVLEFVKLLEARLPVPVDTWDERLTTVEAEKMLIAGGARRAERRRVVDKLAAMLILRSYLAHRAEKACDDAAAG